MKGLVETHWNDRAATFDDEREHGIHSEDQHEAWLRLLREWTAGEHLSVIDVGCGTGVISLLLAELGHDVVGVDFAPEMLQQARSKARRTDLSIEFQRGDAESLPVPDESFELMTARHLVWTLANPADALQEWQRVLESGGRILLIEGYWDHDEPWDEYERIHDELPMYDGRPPEELREVLVETGLEDVTHEPLMDATLWGGEPRHEYYIMSAIASAER